MQNWQLKKNAFDRIIDTIAKQPNNDILSALTSFTPKTDIKLAFQHARGKLKDCKDGKCQTYIDTIMKNYLDIFCESTSEHMNASNTIGASSTHLPVPSNDERTDALSLGEGSSESDDMPVQIAAV